jgi:hypothetical protein
MGWRNASMDSYNTSCTCLICVADAGNLDPSNLSRGLDGRYLIVHQHGRGGALEMALEALRGSRERAVQASHCPLIHRPPTKSTVSRPRRTRRSGESWPVVFRRLFPMPTDLNRAECHIAVWSTLRIYSDTCDISRVSARSSKIAVNTSSWWGVSRSRHDRHTRIGSS